MNMFSESGETFDMYAVRILTVMFRYLFLKFTKLVDYARYVGILDCDCVGLFFIPSSLSFALDGLILEIYSR